MSEESLACDDLEITEIATDLEPEPPQEVLRWGFQTFGDRIALVTSLQRNSLAILDMAYRIEPNVTVITVDTGRLPEATLDFMDQVRNRYPEADWNVVLPDHHEVEEMVRRKGVNLFYESVSDRFLCCHIRKVRPLARALDDLDAWITGLRRDEWVTRAAVKKVEIDREHDGIVKVNPLADWTEGQVLTFTRKHEVPTHPLFEDGYTSIGCAPCSRPTEAGEDSREGRWWWEEDAPKECGMNCSVLAGAFEREVDKIVDEAHD